MMLLRTEKLESGYGPSQVLFGVDLEIAPCEVVSLIGRNGMGKTTTVKTIMGMLPTGAGDITFDGKPIANLPPHSIARLGEKRAALRLSLGLDRPAAVAKSA